MHIHLLGICGTFMASVALIARELGYRVTGCDENVYPPMSTQLIEQGVEIIEGYEPDQLSLNPDLVIIGNALSRGNLLVEAVLTERIPYISAAQWVYEHVLSHRWTLAVSGTHGKTTTSSLLAWILDYAGFDPGFLIGGIPQNFNVSARLGKSPYFVIEADEYDTAFFDKRSKFLHYRPHTLIINNIEFDHADIFDDLDAVKRQFQYLIRTVPDNGLIVYPKNDEAIQEVLEQGVWSKAISTMTGEKITHADWSAELRKADGSEFAVYQKDRLIGEVCWGLVGLHNVNNALVAVVAASHAGVDVESALIAVSEFKSVKRRLEFLGSCQEVNLYDDFAHHPTAIRHTLQGLRNKVGDENIIAVIEPRSNTMRMGHHKEQLIESVSKANQVIWYQPKNLDWDLVELTQHLSVSSSVFADIDSLMTFLLSQATPNTHIIFMSNGGFSNVQQLTLNRLREGQLQQASELVGD